MMINQSVHLPLPEGLLLVLFALLLLACKKGVDPEAPAVIGPVYTIVDKLPIPSGGQAGLNTYLIKNLRYPAEAQRSGIQGRVIVGFVVTDVGRVANAQLEQRIGGGCDEEALRVVAGMPHWTLGELGGKPVNVRTRMPVSFTLL